MPLDPAATTTTTTATSSRPISPLPYHHNHNHYPSRPISTQNPFLYPFGSTRGGFGSLPPPPVAGGGGVDHLVGGYPPQPLLYGGAVRGMNLEYLTHALHATRPLSPSQFPHLAHVPSVTSSPPVKGYTKAGSRSAVSDVNRHKDMSARERSRDDALTVVRGRKVRITEHASLYALCRSWMKNGVNEEIQPQKIDLMNALPKPLPASMVASCMPKKKDDEEDKDEQEEDEKSVKHLQSEDLLKRHIKRAKRVRAQLREERSQRIARYRSRLRLLLPQQVGQV